MRINSDTEVLYVYCGVNGSSHRCYPSNWLYCISSAPPRSVMASDSLSLSLWWVSWGGWEMIRLRLPYVQYVLPRILVNTVIDATGTQNR